MDPLLILGALGIICTSVQLIPQIIKAYRTRSVTDVSLGMLLIILVGTISWTTYGWLIADAAVIIANTINLGATLILLGFKLKS